LRLSQTLVRCGAAKREKTVATKTVGDIEKFDLSISIYKFFVFIYTAILWYLFIYFFFFFFLFFSQDYQNIETKTAAGRPFRISGG